MYRDGRKGGPVKQQPGRARQKILSTYGPPFSPSVNVLDKVWICKEPPLSNLWQYEKNVKVTSARSVANPERPENEIP